MNTRFITILFISFLFIHLADAQVQMKLKQLPRNQLKLISPADGDTIPEEQPLIFKWLPPTPAQREVKYTLKIVEVKDNQSPTDAMRKNKVWFEKKEISTTKYQYPTSAKKFKKNIKYDWNIKAFLGERILAESSPFWFEYKTSNDSIKVQFSAVFGNPLLINAIGEGVCYIGLPKAGVAIKGVAYVTDNNLILIFSKKLININPVVPIRFDFPLHPDFSKQFGYQRMVLKKGNYRIDYKKSKYGELVIPVFDLPPFRLVYHLYPVYGKLDKHNDCLSGTDLCGYVRSGYANSTVSFMLDDNYLLVENENVMENKMDIVNFEENRNLNPDICKYNNWGLIILMNGTHKLDYVNSKYGRVVYPIVNRFGIDSSK